MDTPKELELKHFSSYLPFGLMTHIKFPVKEEIGELKAIGLHPFTGNGAKERITVFVKTPNEDGRQIILPTNTKNTLVKPLLIPLNRVDFLKITDDLPYAIINQLIYGDHTTHLVIEHQYIQEMQRLHIDYMWLTDFGLALNKLDYIK